MERPGLVELLAYARAGDMLAILCSTGWARALAELLATVFISGSAGSGWT